MRQNKPGRDDQQHWHDLQAAATQTEEYTAAAVGMRPELRAEHLLAQPPPAECGHRPKLQLLRTLHLCICQHLMPQLAAPRWRVLLQRQAALKLQAVQVAQHQAVRLTRLRDGAGVVGCQQGTAVHLHQVGDRQAQLAAHVPTPAQSCVGSSSRRCSDTSEFRVESKLRLRAAATAVACTQVCAKALKTAANMCRTGLKHQQAGNYSRPASKLRPTCAVQPPQTERSAARCPFCWAAASPAAAAAPAACCLLHWGSPRHQS